MAEGKGKTKPRSPQQIEEALAKLRGEYDYYCCKTGTTKARAEVQTVTEYRSKIKALYWALGQGEL